MILWYLSRIARKNAPEICNVLFHAPESYKYACDCVFICKWPPRGNVGAMPIFGDPVLSRESFNDKGKKALPIEHNSA